MNPRRQQNHRRSIYERLFEPVDIAYLVFLRVSFGAMAAWLFLYYLVAGVPHYLFVQPEFSFDYRGFGWIDPLPGAGMHVLFAALLLCGVCIALGFMYRLSIWLFFVGWTYFFLIDPTYYLNHFYLVGLLAFLLGWMPANQAFSLDARLRPALRVDTTPRWTLWAIRAQIGIVYFYGGIAKLHPDWLSGAVLRTAVDSWTNVEPIVNVLGKENVVMSMTYGGLILDLAIVPGLLWRKTRWAFVIAAAIFHLINSQIFQIDIFPLMAFCLTLAFFHPDWPRAMLARLFPSRTPSSQTQRASREGGQSSPIAKRLLTAMLTAFFLLQAVIPLRQWIYEGDHNWTNEGYYFAWNVMSRVKQGRVVFMATDPKTETTWRIDPEEFLNARQTRKMAADPQLILQFAHFVGERLRQRGYPAIEVRAYSKVSMNGGPMQFFVDPGTDLMPIPRWQSVANWIAPRVPDQN
jgi:vitamin K-dependent gamma-carboxylase